MSASPLKADRCSAKRNVRYGPKADISQVSLDDLVGAAKHCWGHHKAERLGGFEIDDQFVLGRCLNWKVTRFFAFEDAIDIASRSPELVNVVRPISDQTACGDEEALEVDCR